MKNLNAKNNQGFTIIVAILLTGFLLVLVAWVANFVIRELIDSKAREQYLEAFSLAEGSLELGLKQIKDQGFYYSEGQEFSALDENSKLEDKSGNNYMSYNIDDWVTEFSGTIKALEQVVIPLFHVEDWGAGSYVKKIEKLEVLPWWNDSDLAWNFIGTNAKGFSGIGKILNNFPKDLNVGYSHTSFKGPLE